MACKKSRRHHGGTPPHIAVFHYLVSSVACPRSPATAITDSLHISVSDAYLLRPSFYETGIHLRSLTLCCRHSNEFSAHTWAWPRERERVAPGHCIKGNTAATCVPDPPDLPACLLASLVGFLIEPRACVPPENPRWNFALECLNEGWWSKKVHKKGAECKFVSRLHARWQGQRP